MPINDVQSVNKQHAVPQNIMEVEFKIIGDLTMRQFIYLLCFTVFAYGAYALIDSFFKWFLVLFLIIFGLALAFVPIQDRGLDEWMVNFMKAVYSENQKVWKKVPELPAAFSFENLEVVKQELITLAPTASRRKLEDFLHTQTKTRKRDPLDFNEDEFTQKVLTAYETLETANPMQIPVATIPEPTVSIETDLQDLLPEQATIPPQEEPETTPVASDQTPLAEKEIAPEKEPKTTSEETTQPKIPTSATISEPKTTQKETPEITKTQQAQKARQQKIAQIQKRYKTVAPLTPDMHAGRKFMSLLPKQSELVLPIRGEKILMTTEEEKIEQGIEEKAEQLKTLLNQIKEEHKDKLKELEEVRVQELTNKTQSAKDSSDNTNALYGVKVQIDQIEEQIQDLKKQVTATADQFLRTQLLQKIQRLENMRKENTTELEALKDKPTVTNASATLEETPTPIQSAEQTVQTQATKPGLGPNIVSGKVLDPTNKGIPGVILIIKNDKDEPVRALKTDSLGSFLITTPLANGTYTIETDKAHKTSFAFDIIKFDVKGTSIEPILVKGA